MIRSIGLYDEDAATTPSYKLTPKDKRHDPVVGAGLAALDRAAQSYALQSAERTAIIGITDRGCSAHVAKVTAGIAEGKPRQAFFARAGAQTIATYAAMALNCHGPALTLSGSAATVSNAWKLALQFMTSGLATEVIVIGADNPGNRLVAAALILSPVAPDREDPLLHLLEAHGQQDSTSPVLRLHAAAAAFLQASRNPAGA